MARASDAEWNHWIDTARARDIRDVALQFGAVLRRQGSAEWVGPCPACGGRDRFAVNTQKRVFNCRGAEDGKGDCISLVMHVRGCHFLDAVEALTGTPRPDRSRDETAEARASRERFYAARAIEYARRQAEEAQRIEDEAQRNEAAIGDILRRAMDLEDPRAKQGKAYVTKTRGLNVPRRLLGDIRFVEKLDYWGVGDNGAEEPICLATLPAIVALIRNVEGDIIGLAQTYLDFDKPEKWTPTGSPRNSNKKVRGKKQGGMIRLGPIAETIGIAEGWENALSFWAMGLGPEDLMLAAAVDLGNLVGRSTGRTQHKNLFNPEGRPRRHANGPPKMDEPGVILPAGIKDVIIIADSDSEWFATTAHLHTATLRWMNEGKQVSLAFPPSGLDYNKFLLEELKKGQA